MDASSLIPDGYRWLIDSGSDTLGKGVLDKFLTDFYKRLNI
jgi:hypothetical protein